MNIHSNSMIQKTNIISLVLMAESDSKYTDRESMVN